jgi:hypothetical protein
VVLTSSLSSATISPLHHPPEKEKVVSFSWAVTLPLQLTPWLPKVAHQLSIEHLWHSSHGSASLTDYHENNLILVDLSLIVPPEFLDLHSLWPLLTQPSLPTSLPREDSSLVVPFGSPLATAHAVQPTHLTSLRTTLSNCTQPTWSLVPLAFV